MIINLIINYPYAFLDKFEFSDCYIPIPITPERAKGGKPLRMFW